MISKIETSRLMLLVTFIVLVKVKLVEIRLLKVTIYLDKVIYIIKISFIVQEF